ncbi:MAG TPA: TonB-dependent receptor, partial [Chitinophagaceae bacterium]|nr:TonB-dependent receptor [Chitinophagaceae bacterium]
QVLQKPIEGASVIISGTSRGTTTDALGNFRLSNVPVGSVTLIITSIGYKENAVANITVNAGKEIVLNIGMQEKVNVNNEVTVKANSKKNKPLNELSVVSARAFTVEETQKYAAAINDPLRMATNFAGVASVDDGNNQIVIRGNSPTGLLWRMEGIDIPNPNHFAARGSSGGGISVLSAQLLSNSDFVTGAFAADYGNALSGVFDLKLRKGNNEKRETTLQAGLLGLNVALEGPFSKSYKGSYLVNYRYSTLSLLDKIGVNVGGANATNFQDLSYNISLPANNAGNFTLFGFNGLSNQDFKATRDSLKWESEDDRYDSKFISNTMFNGITHNINIGSRGKLTSAAGYAYSKLSYDADYLKTADSLFTGYKDFNETKKFTVSSTYNYRVNRQHTIRAGGIVNFVGFNYYQLSRDNNNINAPLKEIISINDKTVTVQGFAEWQYKLTDNLTFNTGAHYLQLLYNNTKSIEPRLSVKWDVNKKNTVAFGYGLHSQVLPWGIYFVQVATDNKITTPNKDLGFTKAQHFVVSYNHAFNKDLRLKAEAYYQQLYNVPISPNDTSTVSTLNLEDSYITDALVNKGKGKNYGIEISLEKYLNNHFYFMFSNSVYQSKYTAADGIERNTRFNGNYISNLVAGKEFVYADGKRTLGINIKAVYAGGYRTTPIDDEQSQLLGYTVYKNKEAYSLQNPAYMRADLRVSMKWNKKNFTSTLSLDIQNVTGRKNIYGSYYDLTKNKVITSYQTGFIPVINYIVEF